MLDPSGAVATCNSTHFFIVRKGEVWTSTGMYCLKHSYVKNFTEGVFSDPGAGQVLECIYFRYSRGFFVCVSALQLPAVMRKCADCACLYVREACRCA